MKTIKLHLLVLLMIVLTGCGGTNSPAPSANSTENTKSFDPCSLLTREEITNVLGQQVSEAKLQSTPRSNCTYTVGEGSVTVFAFNDPTAAGAFETGKTMQDERTEPVSGVGDKAYWSPTIKTLNVLKGKVYFTVQYYGIRTGSKETMKALAQKAVTRMP